MLNAYRTKQPTMPDAPLPAVPHLTLDAGTVVYAVGDVHGSLFELRELERRIVEDGADVAGPKAIVMLGDYVDRGLSSAAVLEHLCRPPPDGFERICLRGNHEQMFLGFLADPPTYSDWLRIGGRETLESYGLDVPLRFRRRADLTSFADAVRATIPQVHLDFMRDLPLTVRVGDIVFVHAGLRPGVPMEAQSLDDLLLLTDETAGEDPSGLRVVHGHVASLVPLVRGNRISVDTGAYRTGILSAARVEKGDVRFLKSTAPLTDDVENGTSLPPIVSYPNPEERPAEPGQAAPSEPTGAGTSDRDEAARDRTEPPSRPATVVRFLPEPEETAPPRRPARRSLAALAGLAALALAAWFTDVDAHLLGPLMERMPSSLGGPSAQRDPVGGRLASSGPDAEAAAEGPALPEQATGAVDVLPETGDDTLREGIEYAAIAPPDDRSADGPAAAGDDSPEAAFPEEAEPGRPATVGTEDPLDLRALPGAAARSFAGTPVPVARPPHPSDPKPVQVVMIGEDGALSLVVPPPRPDIPQTRPPRVRGAKAKRPGASETTRARRPGVREERRTWSLFGLLAPRDTVRREGLIRPRKRNETRAAPGGWYDPARSGRSGWTSERDSRDTSSGSTSAGGGGSASGGERGGSTGKDTKSGGTGSGRGPSSRDGGLLGGVGRSLSDGVGSAVGGLSGGLSGGRGRGGDDDDGGGNRGGGDDDGGGRGNRGGGGDKGGGRGNGGGGDDD